MKKKEILIDSDDLLEDELIELKNEYLSEQIDVFRYKKKGLAGIEDEIVRNVNIVFKDFSTISFTRDLMLSGLLGSSWLLLKKCFKYFSERKTEIENVKLDFELTINGKEIPVSVVFIAKDFSFLINNIDIELSKHYEELIEVERFVYIVIKDKRFEFHFI